MKKLIVGLDEAGRGCVIGNLVVAVVVVDKNKELKLKQDGIKDSKMLTKTKREKLFKKIVKTSVEVNYEILKPKIIDYAVFNKHINLNTLELVTMVKLLKMLKKFMLTAQVPIQENIMKNFYMNLRIR